LARRCAALGVDRHHDALRAVFVGRVADHLRVGHGGGVEADLVGARVEQAPHVGHRAHAAAHREWDEHLRRHRFDDVQDKVTVVAGGRDVQKRQLVGALLVVACCHGHRITGIAQTDEVDALDHPTGGHIEARDDAFGEHGMLQVIGSRGMCASGLGCGSQALMLRRRSARRRVFARR
jgi:hypothetical protein